MTKDEFATYFEALQAHDYETFTKYYTPDYRAHFDGQSFDRDGVIAVERKLAEIAESRWDILDVVADDNGIAVRATKLARAPERRASSLSARSLATAFSSTPYAFTVRSPVMSSSAAPFKAPVRSWSTANAGPE